MSFRKSKAKPKPLYRLVLEHSYHVKRRRYGSNEHYLRETKQIPYKSSESESSGSVRSVIKSVLPSKEFITLTKCSNSERTISVESAPTTSDNVSMSSEHHGMSFSQLACNCERALEIERLKAETERIKAETERIKAKAAVEIERTKAESREKIAQIQGESREKIAQIKANAQKEISLIKMTKSSNLSDE